MPILNYNTLPKKEIWPGIKAAFGHSDNITFALVSIEKGSLVAEHSHPHEQWTFILEGDFEFTINGTTQLLKQDMAAHIPSNAPHSARALTPVKAIDCFTPCREDFRKL